MNGLFGTITLIVGIGIFAILVHDGRTESGDIIGWIGAALCTIGGLLTLTGVIGEAGQLASAATTLLVMVTITAIAGGVVLWVRNRPAPTFDDRTQTRPSNYVNATTMAYGTYTRADVQAERAKAQRIRKGVKA